MVTTRIRLIWQIRKILSHNIANCLVLLLFSLSPNAQLEAASRIKDIAIFEGIRNHLLVGYGLIVGLNNTGDTLQDGLFTNNSLHAILGRSGVKPGQSVLNSKNVAAVIVTASLPEISRQGNRIDITVSALGDSSSLLGGTLLVTPLLAADGEVYAVAQGQVAVGGFNPSGNAETITKGATTSSRVANGAVIEREIKFKQASPKKISITLRNPDLTTARHMAEAINAFLGTVAARPRDPGTVELVVPANYENSVVNLLIDIEQLRIEPEQPARVIIDEQNGTVVIGKNVRISTTAISHGNITVQITESSQVAQPGPFASASESPTFSQTNVNVEEGPDQKLLIVQSGITLQDLVNRLNSLGVGPRDLITILQTIKATGALQAEIVAR